MKKVVFSFFLVFQVLIFCAPAMADPKASFRKLSDSAAKMTFDEKKGFPDCPLTPDEAEELALWLQKGYEKSGQKLTTTQVAFAAGVMMGVMVEKDKEKTNSTPPAKAPQKTATSAIPDYDISAYCKRLAQTGGGSYMIEASCVEMEKSAKATIAAMPPTPDSVMKYCAKLSKTGGGAYSILQSCIDMELESKRTLEK